MGSHIKRRVEHESFNQLCVQKIIISTTCTVIAKVFRQADAEESGSVDPSLVPTLAVKVLGNDIKESEKKMIQYKSEVKAGKCLWKLIEEVGLELLSN